MRTYYIDIVKFGIKLDLSNKKIEKKGYQYLTNSIEVNQFLQQHKILFEFKVLATNFIKEVPSPFYESGDIYNQS